ncbi:hypothetical protein I6F11_29480 [Ensifer sp. NBAIM29]|nr:hypothetical protein [Ensifer sp. NBAIM29]
MAAEYFEVIFYDVNADDAANLVFYLCKDSIFDYDIAHDYLGNIRFVSEKHIKNGLVLLSGGALNITMKSLGSFAARLYGQSDVFIHLLESKSNYEISISIAVNREESFDRAKHKIVRSARYLSCRFGLRDYDCGLEPASDLDTKFHSRRSRQL